MHKNNTLKDSNIRLSILKENRNSEIKINENHLWLKIQLIILKKSVRKRMSVILRDRFGNIKLYCKGAVNI